MYGIRRKENTWTEVFIGDCNGERESRKAVHKGNWAALLGCLSRVRRGNKKQKEKQAKVYI